MSSCPRRVDDGDDGGGHGDDEHYHVSMFRTISFWQFFYLDLSCQGIRKKQRLFWHLEASRRQFTGKVLIKISLSWQAGVDVEMLGLLRILCFILITSPPGKNNCHYLCLCRLHYHHHHHYQHHRHIYYPSPQVLLLMCRATPGDRNK